MCCDDYPGAVVVTAPSNRPMKLAVAFGVRSLSAGRYADQQVLMEAHHLMMPHPPHHHTVQRTPLKRHGMRIPFGAACAAVAFFALTACGSRERLSGTGVVVLEGATVFTAADSMPRTNAVIALNSDRIVRVGTVGEFTYGRDVTVINVRGRFIVPGFIDMHAHVPGSARAETARELLTYGITTARSPGVTDSMSGVPLRTQLARGELIGPRLVTGGAFINGTPGRIPGFVNVRSAEEMRAEIRRQKRLGVDLIKLYWDVTPELLKVAVDEAHSLGLQVAGHMRVTSWTEAAQLGINSLEHSGADGPTWELVEDPQLRERLRGQDPPRSASPLKPSEFYSLVSRGASVQGPRMDSLVAALVRNRVAVVPTLVIMQSLYFGDDVTVLRKMEPERMPERFLASWDAFGPGWRNANPFVMQTPTGKAQDLASGKVMLPFAMRVVRALHDRGVLLTTGTDLGMPWITPGVSLHRELELLVEAGISPRDVLLMATRNGAQALGLSAELGTIEAGKVADLIVLRADPLVDIRNTRSIDAVYHAGHRYVPDSLRASR